MARIKLKNKNSLPKGFTVRNGKVIKTYEAGGATTSNTLKPIDRKAANLEAEKGEMALTDTSGDGVFELYDIGGKRHSEGGTPLNLPDQSFIYSDTRGMLLTKDEMKSLGIEQKKRITPAKAAKKFPLNKYIEILEDETSDKIAVETAEQMINKNKIMLSQIAFIQESKKDFENGLPLAAFPYLMSKGVDPQQFQAKIDEVNAAKNPQQPQGMAQGMPPQGMMPPQPPTTGQAEQMMVAQDGLENTPLGKLLSGFKKSSYSVAPVEPTPQDENVPEYDTTACPAFGNPPPSAAMKHAADTNKNYKGPGMMYGGDVEPEAPMDPFPKFQTKGEVSGAAAQTTQNLEKDEEKVEFDLATKCKNTLCTYDEWRFAYRLKDIKEVRFMYESYKTKALDQMKAPEISTEIMPGHENLKNMPYGNMPAPKQQYGTETGQPMVPQMGVPQGYVRDQNPLGLPGMRHGGALRKFVYGGQDDTGITMERSVGIELDPVYPSYTSNPLYKSLSSQLQMMQQDHANAIKYHQDNPHMFKEKKAQEEFENQLNTLQAQMRDVELQMRNIQRDDVLKASIMDYDTTPDIQIADPSMYTGTNPNMDNIGMMMARNGMELPKMQKGEPICTGDNCNDEDHNDGKHEGRNKGRAAHKEFYDHVMSEDFDEVRTEWYNAYLGLVKRWEDVVTGLGGREAIEQAIKEEKSLKNPDGKTLDFETLEKILKNEPVGGKSQQEVFDIYMKMNERFLEAKHAGYEPIDFATRDSEGRALPGYKAICKEFGWEEDCDNYNAEEAKIFQGMFTAMQEIKNHEDIEGTDVKDSFFGNITLDLGGAEHKHGAHRDEHTGLPMSDIDGIIGRTTAGQISYATNPVIEEEILVEIKCDEAEQKRVAARCLKEGKQFDLSICDCKTIPKDPPETEIPPYMTFPQDDLRLQNAIDQKWSRNLYMPVRQNVDPVLPDVAYQDPQAMIQANLSMAQQLAKADPQNASYYMGMISDKINKGISDIANTNIKIFDNSEARKSAILNEAMAQNMANRDEYNTRVATALNNFDNTMIADSANIVDTQVDRMDHADKLYALNMENPNFYYDAQAHMNRFINPQDILADKTPGPMSITDANDQCIKMGYTKGTKEMTACIKLIQGQSGKTVTRSDLTTDAETETDNVENTVDNTEQRYGSEIGCTSCDRKKELARSRKALRNWIFGV